MVIICSVMLSVIVETCEDHTSCIGCRDPDAFTGGPSCLQSSYKIGCLNLYYLLQVLSNILGVGNEV